MGPRRGLRALNFEIGLSLIFKIVLPDKLSFVLNLIWAEFEFLKYGGGSCWPQNFGPESIWRKSFMQSFEFSSSNFEKKMANFDEISSISILIWQSRLFGYNSGYFGDKISPFASVWVLEQVSARYLARNSGVPEVFDVESTWIRILAFGPSEKKSFGFSFPQYDFSWPIVWPWFAS